MSIDLNRFTLKVEAIVPIVNNSFLYKSKRYLLPYDIEDQSYPNIEDGWYRVKISGNDVDVVKKINIEIRSDIPSIKGYIFDGKFIPQNFDVLYRKTGRQIVDRVYFCNEEDLSSIEVILWEDSNLYFYRVNYSDAFIYTIKDALKEDFIRGLPGVTPEIKMISVFYNLREEALREAKIKAEKEEFARTLEGQLLSAFERTEAELIRYSTSSNRIIIDWSIGTQEFNSVLDRETFQVIEAGYCMSGDDSRHNLHSMVVLAKDYDERGLIYKTRS